MARILVAGAGALGSVFGGFLRLAGHDVTLLGRPAHLDAIQAAGLHIGGIWGDHRATGFTTVTEVEALCGRFDVLLLTVKSYDTAAVVRATAAVLADDGVVISLQNGLGNVETIEQCAAHGRILAGRTLAGRTLAGRVIFGAEVTHPGSVQVTVYAEPVLLGAWRAGVDPQLDEQARIWSAHCAASGIPTQYCDALPAALWGKVLYNAALNPLGALLGVHYGALTEHADTRAIMNAVIDEAYAVARADGVQLAWDSAAAYRAAFYERLVPATFHHRSSMLQDLERGRPTEIEAINGQVGHRGAAHGVATPANELLTRLVQARTTLARRR